MADRADVDWRTCAQDGCIGIQLPDGGKCWSHADEHHLESALKQVAKHGRLDARGVQISEELLKRLIAAASSGRQGYEKGYVLGDVRFERAIFLEDADFSGKRFTGIATFVGATFKCRADFISAIFEPRDKYQLAISGGAEFAGANFEGTALFRGAQFHRDANFERAEFKKAAFFWDSWFWSRAEFSHAAFRDDAWFHQTSFRGDARFSGTTFAGVAHFWTLTDLFNVRRDNRNYAATFHGRADFYGATFNSAATFSYVTFKSDAVFSGATFAYAHFEDARFWINAFFAGVTFQRHASFERATFHGDAWFAGARFEQARELGPLRARKSLVLDHAVFQQAVTISASAAACCCRHTQFAAGAQLRLRWAQVVLDDADLSAPSLLAAVPAFPGLDEGRWAQALARLNQMQGNGDRNSRPRLLSLHRANVGGLTAANVDLRACRFAGAHHLDQLRFEECIFAAAPRNWRWTARLAIAEEHQWRASHAARPALRNPNSPKPAARAPAPAQAGKRPEWLSPPHQQPAWTGDGPLSPRQIAGLYRALRKGREDSKDEPGAADFYYGEMEMRRHDRTALKAERLVLFLYWLTSGYALRASRAWTWLLASLVTAALVLAEWGFPESGATASLPFPARLGAAALVAVEGAVFRTSEQQLTYTGQLIQDLLRFAGPVFLGLALLSIRGRVKR
jgi:uncharacterized protein YjbI with pentapeptide repeats